MIEPKDIPVLQDLGTNAGSRTVIGIDQKLSFRLPGIQAVIREAQQAEHKVETTFTFRAEDRFRDLVVEATSLGAEGALIVDQPRPRLKRRVYTNPSIPLRPATKDALRRFLGGLTFINDEPVVLPAAKE